MTEKQRQLIEFTIQDLVRYVVKEQNCSIQQGMSVVYNSQVLKKLQDVETGLYLESPLYVYDLLKDELKFGRIIQNEI